MEALLNPAVLAIVAIILAGLIIFLVVRSRRRAKEADVLPPPELTQPIDYTSLPYEEPTTWSERLRQASPATKALLVLLPIVLIASLAVLYLAFLQAPGGSASTTPQPQPRTIMITSAIVANPARIQVEAETNLPNGATVTAALKENGQDFPWYDTATATGRANNGRISLRLERAANAPVPQQGREYTVVLFATDNNQAITSNPQQLEIPSINQSGFFQIAAAAPTAAPTPAATKAPQATPPPPPATSAATAPPQPTTVVTTTVFNGGNIREAPNLQGKVLGQLHAGEVVKLLEKNADGSWYRVDAPEADGWVSITLLNAFDEAIDAQVPVQGQAGQPPPPTGVPARLTATVFNGGNVRDAPHLRGRVLDQINANESVQLIAKTRDGTWYRIINERKVEGWVSITLLTIDRTVADRVPVAQ